ncbi:MAG: glutamine synthetase [Deltaproteobacteria bacterium]|nr:glutamine synthetase [Deltaproteobacteria bacterium]
MAFYTEYISFSRTGDNMKHLNHSLNHVELKDKNLEKSIQTQVKELKKKGIEFVKYQFTDMQGNIREVTLTVEQIRGIGTTSVDGSSVFGKIIPPTESDMLLMPDFSTLIPIPWSKDTARVICNVFYPPEKEDKEMIPFEGCGRSILSSAERSMNHVLKKRLAQIFPGAKIGKLHAHFAPEIEFLLINGDYDQTKIHLDQNLENNHYFVPPQKKTDDVMKEITRGLGLMGLKKEKFHTEVSTFQFEIGIGHGNVLQIADATMTIKYIIENVAQTHGLKASFIPKFNRKVNGSGMHVHQNLAATVEGKEVNLFFDASSEDGLSHTGRNYFAGLLTYASEITAITNPLPISYKRLVPGREAPTYISWDWLNRTALCRGHSKGIRKVRVEYRSPDPKCNPYLAFAAMLSAGLAGIEEDLELPPCDNRNFYTDHTGVKELPGNLGEALEIMVRSAMLRKRMGNFIIDTLYELGRDLWREYCQEVSDIDIRHYF